MYCILFFFFLFVIFDVSLPRDAMRKRGLCCRPVSVRPSVCRETHTKTQRRKTQKHKEKTETYTCTETLHVSSHITTYMTKTQHYYQEGTDY